MKLYNKNTVFILTLFFNFSLLAQVGIGTTTPDADAMLEISSATRGVLIPRVVNHTTISADTGSDFGLLVYDTTTNSFWYWNGTAWNEMEQSGNAWELTGNAGTNPGTNYIGTSDNQDLIVARNAVEEMRILTDQVSINDNAPNTGDRFTVVGDTDEYAVNGYASGTGWGVYGIGSVGVFGTGATGVYGSVNGATYFGVIANNDNASGLGLLAAGGNASLGYLPGVGANINGISLGGVAWGESSTGTGWSGVGNNLLSVSTLNSGSGVSGTGKTIGVYGYATDTSGQRYGGYFGADDNYVYVGGINNNTDIKIIGSGSVSTIIKSIDGNLLTMTCPEAPEILFQDYGVDVLRNGYSKITIDPNLSQNIRVDNEHPLKVFIQLEGDCNGVYVTNKSADSFEVKELQGGKSNVQFSWSIVATRADEIIKRKDGKTRTSINSERFQPAPGPMKTTKKEINKVKVVKKEILKSDFKSPVLKKK